jgi:hypothetical protein
MVVFADAEEQKRIDFLRKREEEELAQMLSRKYGVEYVDLSLVAVNTDALRLIPEAEAHDAEAAVFGRVGKRVNVAARAPENPKVKALVWKNYRRSAMNRRSLWPRKRVLSASLPLC